MGDSISRKVISKGMIVVDLCIIILIIPIIVSISFCSWFILKAKNKLGF